MISFHSTWWNLTSTTNPVLLSMLRKITCIFPIVILLIVYICAVYFAKVISLQLLVPSFFLGLTFNNNTSIKSKTLFFNMFPVLFYCFTHLYTLNVHAWADQGTIWVMTVIYNKSVLIMSQYYIYWQISCYKINPTAQYSLHYFQEYINKVKR